MTSKGTTEDRGGDSVQQVEQERGSFAPKYLRDLSTQAGKALIFVVILSRIEAELKKFTTELS